MATIINLADGLTGIGQRIIGEDGDDRLGIGVGGGGDFNGDGIMDIVVGASLANSGNGGAYVIFGGAAAFASQIDVGSLGAAGFALIGNESTSYTGFEVVIGGDFNDDDIDDLLVGAPGFDEGGLYYIFGDTTPPTSLDVGSLFAAGFSIDGAAAGDDAGRSIANIGDINGDSLDDFMLGAPRNDSNGTDYGAVYVFFGDASFGTNIDVLGYANITITSSSSGGQLGYSVAAGDINGDGTPDLVLGAHMGNIAGASDVADGIVHVIFGTGGAMATTYDVDSLGAAGFQISGPQNAEEYVGRGVAVVDDVTGDGVADLLIGAGRSGADDQGAVYLIFGSAGLGADIDLGNLGGAGIKISGINANEYVGRTVSSAGDFNGDGINDLLVQANTAAGAVYVIFGRSGGFTSDIDLSDLGATEGIMFTGEATNDSFGIDAAGVGDVNGDGNDDILVGASNADINGTNSGSAYVIFGFATMAGGAGNDSLTGGAGFDSLVGNAGNDTLEGNGGADFLFGGLNDDSIDGGTGDDLLSSGTGNDSMFGGDGIDTAEVGFADKNDFQVRLLTGTQLNGLLSLPDPGDGLSRQAVFTGAAVRMEFTGGEAGFQLLASDIEKVQFGDGTVDLSDIVDLDLASLGIEELFVGGTGDNVVTGEDTNDIMAAGAGNDTVNGVGGDDRAYGQAGDDSVLGGTGDDSLFGNLGADTVMGGDGNDSLKAQTDNDMLMGEAGNDVAFGGGNDDMIDGGAGSDTLNGNSGFDTITGGDGNDTLRGQGGRDSLNGGAGDDLLLGMQGFDTLVGGAGNDGLIGGPANDLLTGGSGIDTFTFAAGHGSNTITDFEDGIDMLSLQGFDFSAVNIASSGANTVITVDGDDLTITLTGISANLISAADFAS